MNCHHKRKRIVRAGYVLYFLRLIFLRISRISNLTSRFSFSHNSRVANTCKLLGMGHINIIRAHTLPYKMLMHLEASGLKRCNVAFVRKLLAVCWLEVVTEKPILGLCDNNIFMVSRA